MRVGSGMAFLVSVLGLTGCSSSSSTADAGPVAHTCSDLGVVARLGAPCDFTGTCPAGCDMSVMCVDGRVAPWGAFRCDAGALDAAQLADAPTDAEPTDAGPCAPPTTAGSCRTTGDCPTDRRCVPPGGFVGCGECVPPLATCASDSDCDVTDVCVELVHPCSCGGPSTECRTRCTPGSCAGDETCNVANGECEPTSCEAGYACPAHTVCDPRPAADPHGCLRDTCSADGDCDCGGGCVDGFCYPALGECLPIPG